MKIGKKQGPKENHPKKESGVKVEQPKMAKLKSEADSIASKRASGLGGLKGL